MLGHKVRSHGNHRNSTESVPQIHALKTKKQKFQKFQIHQKLSFWEKWLGWLTVMEYLCHKWPRICSTYCKHFLVLSQLVTGFVTRLTRRVPLVEQELLTLPEHLSSPPVFSGVRITWSLDLYVCFVDRFCPFVLFLLAIVLSVLLRCTDSDCPFGTLFVPSKSS